MKQMWTVEANAFTNAQLARNVRHTPIATPATVTQKHINVAHRLQPRSVVQAIRMAMKLMLIVEVSSASQLANYVKTSRSVAKTKTVVVAYASSRRLQRVLSQQ